MALGKHFVYAWITYFLALCGVTEYYFDIGSGKIIKSRFLRIYCKLFCILTLCSISWITFRNTHITPKFSTQSHLMIFLMNVVSTITLMTIVNCVNCALRCQQMIFDIIKDLLKIEEFVTELSNRVTASELSHIRKIFWIKILLLITRIIIVVLQAFFSRHGFCIYLIIVASRLIRYGFYFQIFNILWQICNTLIKLQSYLKQLYLDPMSMTRKEQKILEAHRMYYQLIRITNDICQIFKYLMTFWLILMITKFSINGYSLSRLLLGNPIKTLPLSLTFLIVLLSILGLFELYAMASIVNVTASIHDETFQVLRNLNLNSYLLERSNEWLALQLTWQSKSFNIFGVVHINLRMVLLIAINTILSVIYVLQSDYNYIYVRAQ